MAIELHVARSPEAVKATGSPELLEYLEDAVCANCGNAVGYDSRKFIPCAICIQTDEDDVWTVCLPCASAVIYPGE